MYTEFTNMVAEADAVTDEEERIPVDASVEIVGSAGDFFVVKRKG